MTNSRDQQFPLLQRLLLAGGFFAAAGFNPNLVFAQVGANTLPTGGTVAQGSATIGNAGIAANGRNTLAISQTSTAAILNWSSFNVGSNGTVSFQQPSNGVTLNRVNSNQGSEIYGQIQANGSVFLVNPAGILFAAGAQVNVGGLVASTLDISDNNFILGSQIGGYQFNSILSNIHVGKASNSLLKSGEIINQGVLTANGQAGQGGTVALLGQTIKNEGIIAARLGTVALAAGQDISLQFQGSRLLKVQISQAEFDTLIDNKGLIKADGGWVLMNAQTAAGLARAVVNHSGVIEAQTVADLSSPVRTELVEVHVGKVEILADFNHGTVNASGSVDISAPSVGNGGFADTSAANVQIADSFRVNATAANGKTGQWLIDPNDFTIAASGGNITGSALGSSLATADITISTATQGTAGGNGDIFVNDNVVWSNANTLTLNAERHIDFSSGHGLNGGATGNVTLNAGSSGTGAIISAPAHSVLANTLIASAQTGIGSSTQAFTTYVNQAALTNSTSGGIYLNNVINITVAARSTNGDVVIRTNNGGNAAGNGATGGNGGNITVGTVGSLVGIIATDVGNTGLVGNVSLATGNGGTGSNGIGFQVDGSRGGDGGTGGAITVSEALTAARDVVLTTGAGGRGGNGENGVCCDDNRGGWGGWGGNGGIGGAITLSASLNTGRDAGLATGVGGIGGNFGRGARGGQFAAPGQDGQNGSNGVGGGIGGSQINVSPSRYLSLSVAGVIESSNGSAARFIAANNIEVIGALLANSNLVLQNGLRAGDTFTMSNPTINAGSKHVLMSASTLPSGLNITAERVELESLGNITALGTINAHDLALRSHGSIGTASSALSISGVTNSLWLEAGADLNRGDAQDQGSGSAHVSLTRNHHLGARIHNGVLDVSASSGIGGAPNIQVGSTPFGSGINVTADAVALANGMGNVTLSAAAGANGVGSGGAGSQGGNVLVAGSITAAGDINLRAGNGGAGASNAVGNGGMGGAGGSVTLNAGAQLQGRSLHITSGSGLQGGDAAGALAGDGGSAGHINLSAATALNFTGGVTLQSGSGGKGGSSVGYAWGGHGGNVSLGSLTTSGDLSISTGAGGQIGAGIDPIINGLGGVGGSIGFAGALSVGGKLSMSTGNGAHARSGGSIAHDGAVTVGGDINVSTGSGGSQNNHPGYGFTGSGGNWQLNAPVSADNITATLGAAGGSGANNGAVTGSNVRLSASGNMQINGALAPTSSSAHLSATTFSGSLNASGHQLNISTPGGAAAWNLSGISADILTIDAQNGIGSSSQALNTSVNQAALTNSIGSGIYLTNAKDITVAARSTNGDVVISTANVFVGLVGGNINVDTVAGLTGITATDPSNNEVVGHISLSTGNGGSGINRGYDGHAFSGGAITLNAALNSAGDVRLSTGWGGIGQDGSVAGSGGTGGNGGAITVSEALNAGRDAVFTTGRGGLGGWSTNLANAGTGGNGGAITVSAALNARRDAVFTTGFGARGGNGGEPVLHGTTPGSGGNGGSITLVAASVATRDASLTTGAGGAGGFSYSIFGVPRNQAASGMAGRVEGIGIDLSAGGSLSVAPVIAPTSGAVNLTAGTGISNGAGGAVQVQASQLNLRNSTSGDVLVSNTGNIAFTGGASNVGQAHVVSTAGNITLDSALNATGAGDAIRFAGVNFINNAGASALSTPAGRWIVWSTAPQANRFGGLQSGSAVLWSTAYNSASPTVSDSGNRFAFTLAQPTGVAIAASDVIKIYGDAVDFSTASLGNGYSLVSLGSGASWGNAFTDVGVSVAGITLTGTPVLTSAGAAGAARRDAGDAPGQTGSANYAININTSGVTAKNGAATVTLDAPVNGILTITPRALTGNVTADTRTYDGTTKATVANSSFTGLVNGNTAVTLSPGSVAFSSANAGNNIALTLGSSSLSGADAVNYTLGSVSGSGNINKAALTAKANNTIRTYDGTTNGNNSGVAITGFVNNETSSVVNQNALSFNQASTRNAGSYTLAASGLAAQNYDIAFSAGNLTINKADLTLSAVTDSRAYNGLAGSTAAPTAIGIVAGDSFTASQSFDSANAGSRTLSVNSGYMLNDGNSGNNYNVTVNTASGTITKAALTATANTTTRTYDGTSNGNNSGVTITGMVNNEASTVVNQSGLAFTNPTAQNAGSYSLAASGLTAQNYDIAYTAGNLQINKAALTVTANNDSRTYNGTIYSGVNNTGGAGVSYSGFVNSETTASLSGALTYGGSAAGSRNAGTFSITPGGLIAQNYDITFTNGSMVTDKANATLSATTDARQYNGLAGSDAAPTAIGIVAGDSFTASQSFDSANAGSRTLSVNSGYMLNDGNSGNNYNLTLQTASGSISKASLTATANTTSRTYDGTTNGNNSGVSITGMVNGEASNVVNQTNLTFTNQTAQNAGSYSLSASGLSAQNYDIAYTAGNLHINKAALSVTANNASRTYDGNTYNGNNGVSYQGFVNSETTTSLGGSLSYSGSAQGSRNAGTFSIAPGGLTAGNYDITFNHGSLTTNKANATLIATTDSRTYNGLAGSDAAPTAIGIVAGDSLTASQSFDSANAGSRTLSVNGGYMLNDGNSGNNYNLTLQTASGSITKASLTATANTTTRTYDGTTNGNNSGVSITGMVNGETSTVVNQKALSFDQASTRNAGSYSLNASGLSAQNYDIAYTAGNMTISKAALSIRAVSDSRVYNGLTDSNATPLATTLGAGDTLTGLSQSFDAANAGARTLSINGGYAITSSSGSSLGNYNINTQTASGGISQAPLSVTANNAIRTYDGTSFMGGNGASYSGFVNSETVSALGGGLTYGGSAQGSRNVGTFSIIPSGYSSGNYNIGYQNGSLTTNKANLNINATSDSRAYSGLTGSIALPTAIGIVAGDSLTNLSQSFDLAAAGSRTLNVHNSYTLSDGNGGNNYQINLQSAAGSISPANLTIRAGDASLIQGQTMPLLSATYLGLVNGETPASLTNQAQVNTPASSFSPQGNYPIIASGAGSPNYTISYQNGQLQIAAAPLPIAILPPPPPAPPAPNPSPPAPASNSPSPSSAPSPAPAGSPLPAPASAPAPAPEGQGQDTQSAGGSSKGNNSFAFAPETEEEKATRLRLAGLKITIVDGGVKP